MVGRPGEFWVADFHLLRFGLRLPGTLKWLSGWAEPRRGDVIVLASPADGHRPVERVLGK